MRAGHDRHDIQGRHGGGGRRAQSGARSSYFICVRLPEELDSKLHNFVDRNCNSADLLDNRGNQQEIGSGSRLDLHVTFTRRVPAGIDKDLIRREVKEEAAKLSKSPITLTFGSMYCSKVNRIEHSDVQCIGIPLDSPDLDALRTAIASGLEGADKGYAGAGIWILITTTNFDNLMLLLIIVIRICCYPVPNEK